MAGIHITQTLKDLPGVRQLSNDEPTNRDGERLDLAFITEELYGATPSEVRSDHFAIQTNLMLRKVHPPLRHQKDGITKKQMGPNPNEQSMNGLQHTISK